jgi:protein involved in polysaccharide export with SLBB domain
VPDARVQSSAVSTSSTETPAPTTIIEKKRFIDFAQLRDQEQQLITLPRTKRSEILMPGDQIEITLYEKLPVSQEKRTEMKRVDDRGTVFIYPLGKLFLAGLSLNEARDLVTRSMESYIINPVCEISLLKREYEPHVFVFGEAKKCGSYPLKIGDRLLDILSYAGGPTPKAYTAKITVVRLYGDSIGVMSIDLNSILEKGRVERNIIIQDQDIVYLPESLYSNIKEILTTLGTVLPWYYFMKNF